MCAIFFFLTNAKYDLFECGLGNDYVFKAGLIVNGACGVIKLNGLQQFISMVVVNENDNKFYVIVLDFI